MASLKSKSLIDIITVSFLLLIAGVIFLNNTYAHFYADDYLYSYKFNPGFVFGNPAQISYDKIYNVSDFVGSLQALYNNLTGRIVGHGMLQLVLMLPAWVFDFLNTCVFMLLTLLMAKWVRKKGQDNFLQYWLLVILLYYLAVSNTIPNFYFPAFSCNYLWTQLIVILLFVPLLRMAEGNPWAEKSLPVAFLMFFAGVIAGDTNEPLVPGLLLAWGFCGLYLLVNRKKIPLWYFTAFLGICLGFAFLIFAPGNQQRILYESQQGVAGKDISLHPGNLKVILYTIIGMVQAILMALTGIIWPDKEKFKRDILPIVIIGVYLIGIITAILFTPAYIKRMNILFTGAAIVFMVLIFSAGRFSKKSMLFLAFAISLPLAGLKIYSDFHRLSHAKKELNVFNKQVNSVKGDSVLVSPRAYVDPLTKENWAKPIAKYYGKSYVWVVNDLDNKYLMRSTGLKYRIASQTPNSRILLDSLKYTVHDNNAVSLYAVLEIDTLQYDPEKIDIKMYYSSYRSSFMQHIYNLMPIWLVKYVLKAQPSFRLMDYKKINHSFVYSIIAQEIPAHFTFMRLRIACADRKINDIVLKDVTNSVK
jgi:hypothetical protein